tara:strand:- start:426 stop:890 length:465 start_codon:yes stop_codon:yes gene_type:complete
MNEFVLKKLNKNNCSSLYFFQKKFKELENNIWKTDDLENLISKQSCFGKLCFKKKSIVGFCIGNQLFDILEIYSIFVHPSYRRNGIAKKILEECIIFCQEKKVKKIILEVNITNEVAKKFYTLNEFKNCGLRKDYYFSESGRNDAQLMELQIIE